MKCIKTEIVEYDAWTWNGGKYLEYPDFINEEIDKGNISFISPEIIFLQTPTGLRTINAGNTILRNTITKELTSMRTKEIEDNPKFTLIEVE